MVLFFLVIFSFVFFFSVQGARSRVKSQDIDLIQLEQKIRNGEISQVTVRPTEIVACNRSCDCEYHTYVTNRASKEEIIRQAREIDASGAPRVAKVEEQNSQPTVPAGFPVGIIILFGAHMFTILLIMAMLPVYIILAVKNERLDQTTRIIWVILICMLGMLANPVYWYLYVWRKPPNEGTVSPT
jgi:ATP-dependent Zn protease